MRDANATASVEAIERAIRILDVFSVDRPELGVAEISRALGLKRSTVHRALVTMEAGGLLRQVASSQKYALGSKVLRLAHVLQSQLSLASVAMPTMRDVRNRINETVALHVVEGLSRVVAQQVESTHDIRRIYHEMGKPLPLHIGSSGKAILSFMSRDDIRRVIAGIGDQQSGPDGAVDVSELMRQLEEIRRVGYCVSVGERTDGITSISSPVLDHSGRVVAAVNVSGPSGRFTHQKALQCLPVLKPAVLRISRDLGYSGPDF